MSWLKDLSPQNALVWLDFRSQFDRNGLRIIENAGKLATSPSVIICGDGTTTSTFPSQLVGSRGIGFDGGDYVKFTLSAPGPNWTAISLCNQKTIGTADWLAFSLFGTLSNSAPNSIGFGVQNSTKTVKVLQEAIAWGTAGPNSNTNINSYCLTVSGTSAVGYLNATQVSTLTLTGTFANQNLCVLNGNLFTAGGVPVANREANHYFFALFPKLLTPQQISMLHDNLMHQFNLP